MSASLEVTARKRILREIEVMKKSDKTNISAGPIDEKDISKWEAIIIGPKDTPYEGGIFKLSTTYTHRYPFKAPKVRFITKIYHCNIYDGVICLDILYSAWSSVITTESLLIGIASFLSDPNPTHLFNPEATKLYLANKEEYNKMAREYTQKYASKGAETSEASIQTWQMHLIKC